jgi:type II secretory pathway component PulJ
MSKQAGISALEMLLCLSIMAMISGYTLSVADEVEAYAQEYHQQMDINAIRDKIYARPHPSKAE